jgi:hypothetical protein
MIEVVVLIGAFFICASFVWCCDPTDSHITDAMPRMPSPKKLKYKQEEDPTAM